MATITSQQHDVSRISVGAAPKMSDPAAALRSQITSIKGGGWDAAEYGITAEQQVVKLEEALVKVEADMATPEWQERAAAEAERVLAEMRARAIDRADLDVSNGRVNVVVAGTPAWHGLGVNVSEAMSWEEAARLSGLAGWNVEQWALSRFSTTKASEPARDIDGWVANVRSDTKAMLGIVGAGWEPLQNTEAFQFMDQLYESGAAKWETAGSINGGKRVWMQARLPKTIEVVPGDEVRNYALLMMGHDGTMAIWVLPTNVRVVCQNTGRQALSSADERKLRIRHNGDVKAKVLEAKKALGIVGRYVDVFEEEAKMLARVQMNGQSLKDYFETFFPTTVQPAPAAGVDGASVLESILDAKGREKDVVAELLSGHYAETERIAKRNTAILEQLMVNFEDKTNTLPGMAGSAWAAYNSVTEWADHQKSFRSADSRLNSAWFGAGNELKQEAFAAAKELATSA